jgi:hypothetical protein
MSLEGMEFANDLHVSTDPVQIPILFACRAAGAENRPALQINWWMNQP